MAKKNICEAETVSTLNTATDSIFAEVGGSLRRIKVTDLDLKSEIAQGGEVALSQVAWGANIKQGITSNTDWGTCGNMAAWVEYKARSGRYLVTPDGKAARIADDGTHFTDGTAVDESKGNIMVIAPALHYLWDEGTDRGYPVLWMSAITLGGHSWGNADSGRYVCYGAYPAGDGDGGKIKSGTGYVPKANTNITNFWNAAQKIGKDWGLVDYPFHQWIFACVLSEYGNSNGQSAAGAGAAGTGASVWDAASKLVTGATKSIGAPFGKMPVTLSGGTDCSRICTMWCEDKWGLRWEATQGCYFGSSANSPAQDGTEAFIYEGNRLPADAELKGTPAGTYRKLTRMTASSGSFISKIIGGEHFDILASEKSGGGASSCLCDKDWCAATGQLCLLGGGFASAGSGCGPVAADSDCAFGGAAAHVGSRLAYYGPLIFADGKAL